MASTVAYVVQAGDYVSARVRVKLTPGDSVRNRVVLGAERAEKLARALHVHPAVLLWPNWDMDAAPKRAVG